MEASSKIDPKLSLEVAKRDLARAEAEVDTALSVLRAAPRAEKTGITRAVEDAFEKVRAARRALDALQLEPIDVERPRNPI